jgi:hypothetical protein
MIVSMSFGEFVFYAGFTQKTAKHDLNIKRYRGIILWRIHRKVSEDSTLRQGLRACQVGPAGPTPMPPGPLWWEATTSFWSILPPPPMMHLSRT